MSGRLTRVYHAPAGPTGSRALAPRRPVARIELWNGDICDLEVDAIVNAAQPVPVDVDRGRWRDQAGGRRLDRVRGRPPGARGPRRGRRHARRHGWRPGPSSTRSRSIAIGGRMPRSSTGPSAARWPAPATSAPRSIAFPAMGTGVGGFPLDEAARVTVLAVREELALSPRDRARDLRDARRSRLPRLRGGPRGHRPAEAGAPGAGPRTGRVIRYELLVRAERRAA